MWIAEPHRWSLKLLLEELKDGLGRKMALEALHDSVAPHSMDGTDGGKTLYIVDYDNSVIRKVSISIAGGGDGAVFNVTTIAGSTPVGLALNPAESALYIGDVAHSAIRRINLSTMMVETLLKNSPLTPTFLTLTPDGDFVIFSDSRNHRILVSPQ